MYTAVVETIVLYAASVWAPAAKKLGVRKQLNTVQRGIAQKKNHKSVPYCIPTLGASIGWSIPLDLRVQEAASLFVAKRGKLQSVLADRVVETKVSCTELPHPASDMDLKFICLINEDETRRNNIQSLRIFTDGSKIEGKVGAALYFWNSAAEIRTLKLKLWDHCTVYQAELLAIYMATERILSSAETTFGVYSDSRSALETIVNQDSQHPLAVKTRKNIHNILGQQKNITTLGLNPMRVLQKTNVPTSWQNMQRCEPKEVRTMTFVRSPL
ncbi:unnamed protein product [Parnassius mnemosyne]|uniref:RNase H type-1 domain-containing protein n=1 Tax=Parnassius mnemosyne TaxID=213953 RepID=A0AAV1L7A8_9NEOP